MADDININQNTPGKTHSDQAGISKSMSDAATQNAMNQSSLADDKPPGSPTSSNDPLNTMNKVQSPSIAGEQSISGDMPDPKSDDNALDAAHQMGIGLSSESNHPSPLDTASDVDQAEEYNKTH